MKLFAMFNGFYIYFLKSSMLDVWLGSEHASELPCHFL